MTEKDFDTVGGAEGLDNAPDTVTDNTSEATYIPTVENSQATESSSADASAEAKQTNEASGNNVPPVYNRVDAQQSSYVPHTDYTQNTYGGFSQKWNYERYEKSKKSGKGIKVLAIVMSILFGVTLITFAGYYISNKIRDAVAERKLPDNSVVNDDFDTQLPEQGNKGASISDKVTYTPYTQTPDISSEYTGKELTSQEIIALATPSVVGIKTMIEEDYGWYYGTQTYEGVGSGFIITEDGYVVTNYHVIDGAVSVKVLLSDGTEYEAETIGYDALSDVAVLKVEATGLPALVIGNSEAVVAGDSVIAIGCPSGINLAGTATRGMVSKVNREIAITDNYGRTQKKMSVIQIDAAINPGNSGGPLLNSRGEVIGINTLKLSSTGYEGIGFALPINGVMELVNQICENGAVVERPIDSFVTRKAALGITYREITATESKTYQIPQGVMVVLISQGSAAQNSGMKRGDIIVSFDGKNITTDDELIGKIDSKRPGDKVDVRVYRDGEYIDLEVVLSEAS